MNEAILIVILLAASLLIYALSKKFAGVALNPFGLILLWPIVLAAIMGYGTVTKVVSFVLVIPAIYLIARSVEKAQRSEQN
jgi:large-conductance mechanosensitive channel